MTGRPLNVGFLEELPPDIAERWFGATGRYGRLGVHGDGSCFFHSVCAAMDKEGYNSASAKKQKEIVYEFRCSFQKAFNKTKYIAAASPSSEKKDFEETRDGFCEPSTWADETMIRHASNVLDMNLVFLDIAKNRMYCGVHGGATLKAIAKELEGGSAHGKNKDPYLQPTVVIAWVGHKHFEPIVRITSVDGKGVHTRGLFLPASNKQDKATVKTLMERYMGQCDL